MEPNTSNQARGKCYGNACRADRIAKPILGRNVKMGVIVGRCGQGLSQYRDSKREILCFTSEIHNLGVGNLMREVKVDRSISAYKVCELW